MRKLVWITTAIAALTGVGMAVADHMNTHSLKAVSATFTAPTASVVRTSTCTGADGTYATTSATYTGGTAVSTEPSLNGAISIDTESLINTTNDIGTVSGRIRIGSGHDGGTRFSAVYSKGKLAGLVSGGNERDSSGQLLGNLSATFSTAGGFTDGKIGGGTTGGDAVLISSGGCKPTAPPKPDVISVEGTVSASSGSSVTAAGITCVVPSTLSSTVTGLGLVNGTTRVDMTCTVSGGVNTLSKISIAGNHDSSHKH